ncbi:MAG: glycosyltransferase family 9 protein [Chthoniobacterales bacterium]
MAAGNSPDSILLIKPSSLGDIIHALPVAEALKTAYPNASLSWVVNEEWTSILGENPFIDHILPFPRQKFRGVAGIFGGLGWISGLRHLKPDLCVDLQGLLRSALIGRGAGCGELVGLSDAREGATLFYHRSAKVTKDMHAVDRYLSVLDVLGIERPSTPRFILPQGLRPPSFSLNEPYLLLHPFSRGEGKSMDIKTLQAFCNEWKKTPIVIVGRVNTEVSLPPSVINLLNRTTLMELIWLIRHAGFVISVDSGPMHICAGITERLLSIHTWSDPRRVGPYPGNCAVWKNGSIQTMTDFRQKPNLSHKQLMESDLGNISDWASAHFLAP